MPAKQKNSERPELRETFNDFEAVEIVRNVAGETGEPTAAQNVRGEVYETETGTICEGGVRGVYKKFVGAA